MGPDPAATDNGAESRLPPALSGERRYLSRAAGRLGYYVAGSGPPALLVHSINAAASAYEVRPIFERLVATRTVYAPDLPGFGISDRSDRDYRIDTYVQAVTDMLDLIAQQSGQDHVDALALSLSCEFLARAATRHPERIRTLAFVTPTGFERGSGSRRGPAGASREVPGLRATLSVPLWRRPLYDLLVSRPSIRFFLEKTWGSKQIDEGAFQYAYKTSHQPGAEFAPYAFVSGRLFAKDIRTIYEGLKGPILVMHGTKGDFQDFSEIGWTAERANWRVRAFETGALVPFERPNEMMEAYEAFLTDSAGP